MTQWMLAYSMFEWIANTEFSGLNSQSNRCHCGLPIASTYAISHAVLTVRLYLLFTFDKKGLQKPVRVLKWRSINWEWHIIVCIGTLYHGYVMECG